MDMRVYQMMNIVNNQYNNTINVVSSIDYINIGFVNKYHKYSYYVNKYSIYLYF